MKNNNKILLIISLWHFFVPLILFNQTLNSTPDDFRFKKIGIEEGLSQSTILCILQDKLGYLWFGTANGLNRYDGYEFVVYTNLAEDSLSISDNEITSLFEDDEGFIWIGTAKGMLNKFDPKTETFQHYDIASSSDWYSIDEEKFYDFPLTFSRNQNSTITTIDQDSEGFLWIGTWGKGLLKFHHKTNQKKYIYHFKNRINSLSSNKIVKIYIDKNQTVWIGTFGGGLNRIDSTKSISIKFTNKNQYINFAKIGERISSIAEDMKGNIIVGDYNNGVTIIDYSTKYNAPNDWKISKLKLSSSEVGAPNIMAVTEDKSNNIWIGTSGKGLFKYDQNANSILHYNSTENPNSLSENEIQTIYVDNSGIVWVGTQLGSGINKLESNKNKFNSIPIRTSLGSSLNDNIIWSIYEDTEKNLWIGTFRGGLNKYDLKNNSFAYYDADKVGDNHVRSIVEDYKGNLWIGTYSAGLTFYNKKENHFRYFGMSPANKSLRSNQIQSFLIEGDTTLYIGTFGGGMSKLSLNNFYKTDIAEFTTYSHNPSDLFSISDDRIYYMLIDEENNFWIATHGGGLNLFDRSEKIFTSFRSDKNKIGTLSDDRLMVISETKDDKLLIGTFGGGIDLFDPKTITFTNINKMNGMDCSDVYAIVDDSISGYWLSSNNGIFKLDYDLKSYVRYGLLDGLQSLEFNGGASFTSQDGLIYFGGINGINYFNPSEIKIDNFNAPIVITKIKLFDKEIKGAKTNLTFTKDENYFSFEFASLDYKKSGKNKYKFMLEGFDKQWSYTDASNRKVFYTNLNPGDYKFIVTGTNNDGIWSPQFASVNIKILAPFWMQWWFIALLILFIGGMITFYINQRIKYLVAMDKLKTNLSADLHDNVGAGLTEISILSELTSSQLSNSGVSKNLTKISELSRQLVESMSDIVWVVNPNRDSLYDLIVRLKDSYAELLGELGINLQTTNLEKLISIKLPIEIRQNLYLILKESINNSIKHGACKTIELNITQLNKKMIIEVLDDGKGFDINLYKSGNGLLNIKQRAKNINWEISVSSELGNGTKVIIMGKV